MKSGWLCRVMQGWLAACATATAAIYVLALPFSISGASARSMMLSWVDLVASLIFFPVILVFTCGLTAIPAALVVWIGEVSRIRSPLFLGGAGGTIGALSQTIAFRSFDLIFATLFVLVGVLAGLTYWRVAVKPADGEPDQVPSA
ncbi:hypothetical protein [Bradyrhizobium roseum]|uniref:hypothetical protein n=1 Tax=Bradyrhizobium roseum TaxID=3056648 RepID=UPI0026156E57|nr:hypothetical protein [Bradyrhizobium roseus]WKA31313.1 hypothetical protein QUH67_14610 [Bradyrhizobium roseus]